MAVLKKLPDNTIELTITIQAEDIKKTREMVVEGATKTVEVPGFRKGKAPKNVVEGKLSKEAINEEILKTLLPNAYAKALQELDIKPIIQPKIHVNKIEEGKDWEFIAKTCELPDVDLGAYKESIQKVTAKTKIIIPGKPETEVKFEDIVKALLENVKATIPYILIEQETDRLLSQLLEDVRKLGLTLDQYLGSTGKTPDAVRKEFEQRAENDIKLEFALQKIAETEKISVEEKEIQEALLKAPNDQERASLESNKYLLASILRQQKTLDFLKNL